MAGVNVKMGVSGVAQFKQGMKESQAAVKTLDQELKLNEQYLKTNGDAQAYMQKKSELLKEQIRLQTDVVNQSEKALEAMAKNGVKQSSTAFQSLRQQSIQAQTQLLNMQNELDNIGTAGETAADGLSEINHQLDSVRRNVSWENVANGIDKITEKMETAAKAAWNMGKKIVQATLGAGQWADDLQTTADQWEMSPEQVYRMRATAQLIDTDAETIFQARQKLIKAMGQGDNKETMGAFAALGISDLTGSDKNIEDVFWNAGKALMDMGDKVDRNEYAMKLYGRSWTDLIPIFKAGRQTYEETMNSWTWLGDEQFQSLTSLNDEQMKLQTEWENFQHQFEAALAPAITNVMEILERLMHEFNVYLQSDDGQKMLESLGEAVRGLFTDLQNVKPEEVMEKLKGGLDAIKEGFEWIIQNKDGVVTALKVIAGGFAVLKIGGVVANVMQLVSGFRGLMGGGGGASAVSGGAGGASTAAAAGGGFFTGVSNGVRGAAARAGAGMGNFLSATGGMMPALFDRLLYETNAGRALQSGGDVLAGLSQDFEEKKAEVQQNASTFLSDWMTLFQTAGDNAARFWNQVWFGNEYGANYRQPEEIMGENGLTGDQKAAAEAYWDALRGWSQNHDFDAMGLAQEEFRNAFQGQDDLMSAVQDLIYRLQEDNYDWQDMEDLPAAWDKFTETAGEMNAETNKASADMTEAANGLKQMPNEMYSVVEKAIRSGMSGITIVVNESAVDTIGRRMNTSFGDVLQSLGVK